MSGPTEKLTGPHLNLVQRIAQRTQRHELALHSDVALAKRSHDLGVGARKQEWVLGLANLCNGRQGHSCQPHTEIRCTYGREHLQ